MDGEEEINNIIADFMGPSGFETPVGYNGLPYPKVYTESLDDLVEPIKKIQREIYAKEDTVIRFQLNILGEGFSTLVYQGNHTLVKVRGLESLALSCATACSIVIKKRLL